MVISARYPAIADKETTVDFVVMGLKRDSAIALAIRNLLTRKQAAMKISKADSKFFIISANQYTDLHDLRLRSRQNRDSPRTTQIGAPNVNFFDLSFTHPVVDYFSSNNPVNFAHPLESHLSTPTQNAVTLDTRDTIKNGKNTMHASRL